MGFPSLSRTWGYVALFDPIDEPPLPVLGKEKVALVIILHMQDPEEL